MLVLLVYLGGTNYVIYASRLERYEYLQTVKQKREQTGSCKVKQHQLLEPPAKQPGNPAILLPSSLAARHVSSSALFLSFFVLAQCTDTVFLPDLAAGSARPDLVQNAELLQTLGIEGAAADGKLCRDSLAHKLPQAFLCCPSNI